MAVDLPASARQPRRSATARFVIRVGAEWVPVRAAEIASIAEVLEAGADPDATVGAREGAAERLALDLVDSGMIAPPRPRRRRQRVVSSRAVFYQAADA